MRSPAEGLAIWTIYARPRDLPAHAFVARAHHVGPRGIEVDQAYFTGETIGEIRAKLPIGLYRQARQPGDDPAIVEVWF